MTDTDLRTLPDAAADAASAPRKRVGLSGMVLADLRTLATEVGVSGTAGMRKGDLIAAIKERQGGTASTSPSAGRNGAAPTREDVSTTAPTVPVGAAVDEQVATASPTDEDAPRRTRQRRAASRPSEAAGSSTETPARPEASTDTDQPPSAPTDGESTNASGTPVDADRTPDGDRTATERPPRRERQSRRDQNGSATDAPVQDTTPSGPEGSSTQQSGGQQNGNQQNPRSHNNGNQQNAGGQQNGNQQNSGPQGGARDRDDDNGEGRGRRGGRRFRERRRGRDRGTEGGVQVREERDVEVRDDDVLQPVAGILDVLDNYAFVRTTGYLAGSNDVYVSMNLVRKNGLRRGDAVTGAVRIAREGEQPSNRQKFNPLVRIDTINGGDAEAAKRRPEFGKLTPLYPNQRLRLETTPNVLTTRVIDLVMPIGKGQRALIVSPPKAGKTRVLQAIANAIAVNNPECHLMVVLIDERPEEVTDMQRSVKGEVIASTFDRPPGDHTAVAELAIERAKRLVESGMDVVVLLDSITRLGRAYNNSSPASGRILSGGVDSTALYPPKRFLGAARNIEEGGSLTILATALVETGSTGDTVIFEEFKGTGNAELKLDRKIAERRVFPAVDVNPSSTRKDELLMNPDEYQVILKLRRVLAGLDSHQAIDLLIDRLRKTGSNAEFMMQVAKNAPGGPVQTDES
ncbi:MAG: transcription termination factor Rho [Mycobacteriaceae bacterium]